jgi:type IV pilus assembly protein PilE
MARRCAGFSLIELLVALALVGILTALAMSVYRHYTWRAWRTEAITALSRVQTAQESYRNVYNRYTDDLAALGVAGGCSEHCVYTIDFPSVPDTQAYTVRARPTAGGGRNGVNQTGDADCQWFSVDASGRRSSGPSTQCWQR